MWHFVELGWEDCSTTFGIELCVVSISTLRTAKRREKGHVRAFR